MSRNLILTNHKHHDHQRRDPESQPQVTSELIKEIQTEPKQEIKHVQEVREELPVQQSIPEPIKPVEIKQELPPSQPSPQDRFKEEERMAQEILKKLQDKKINKPRWAL
ncbi:MAG: hypothetical protein WC595_04295 [Candidatus Nanoarchaeia archaeon]